MFFHGSPPDFPAISEISAVWHGAGEDVVHVRHPRGVLHLRVRGLGVAVLHVPEASRLDLGPFSMPPTRFGTCFHGVSGISM